MGEQLSGLLGGTGGQLCFLRDGSLATEPPNLYHCHSYLHYTDHTCLAEWANLLQHDLPGRNVFGIDLPFSVFKPVIDTSKCNGCGLCTRNCKAACINAKAHEIDYSRCVACMDCIDKCRQGAIRYTRRKTNKAEIQTAQPAVDKPDRRKFFTVSALLATSAALKAQEKYNSRTRKSTADWPSSKIKRNRTGQPRSLLRAR